jgi:hypothetical protein
MKLIIFLYLNCLIVSLSAGERLARVLYYGASSEAPQTAFVYQADSESQEVELGRHNFSESFEVSDKTDRLYFLPSVLPEDTPLPTGAPSVAIGEDWNKILILVFRDESNPIMPIRLRAINANDDAFGPGELYFVNFSEMTVFGLVGEKKIISKPRSIEVVSEPRQGRGRYILKLDAFKDSIEDRRRLIKQKCFFDPNARVVTFLVPLPYPRMVKLYSAPIYDF